MFPALSTVTSCGESNLAALPTSIVNHPVNADRRWLRRAQGIDLALRLIITVVPEFDVGTLAHGVAKPPADKQWTPDEMSKDPEAYLRWADAKIEYTGSPAPVAQKLPRTMTFYTHRWPAADEVCRDPSLSPATILLIAAARSV